jgi:glucokinase
MTYVAAIDIGGTSIKAALVDDTFTTITTATTPTPKDDRDGSATVKAILGIVSELEKSGPVSAIGFDTPGTIDESRGIARWAGNLGWKDLEIRSLLQAQTQHPVVYGHDVRCGALAELRSGAAKGFQHSIFIPIGTGIAAALIVDGAIRAVDGYAGEIGHMNVGADIECVCGLTGCLEAVSSAAAIEREYERNTGAKKSAEEIAKSMGTDPQARAVWESAMHYLAVAVEDLITLLAPEAIIFGGGLAGAGSLLIDPVQRALDKRLTFQRRPLLKVAHYGSSAGTIGCAIMAFDALAQG